MIRLRGSFPLAVLLVACSSVAQERDALRRSVQDGFDALWHAPLAWGERLRSAASPAEANTLRIRHRALTYAWLARTQPAWTALEISVRRGERVDEVAELERLTALLTITRERLSAWETAFLDESLAYVAFQNEVQGLRRTLVASAFPEIARIAEAHALRSIERRRNLHADEPTSVGDLDAAWDHTEIASQLTLVWTAGLERLVALSRTAPTLQLEVEVATTLIAELPGAERDAARKELQAFVESLRSTVERSTDLAALGAVVDLAARRSEEVRQGLESRLSLLRSLTSTEELARRVKGRVERLERTLRGDTAFPDVRRRVAVARTALERRRTAAADPRAGEEAFDRKGFERAVADLEAVDPLWPDVVDRVQRELQGMGWRGPDAFAQRYEEERLAWSTRADAFLDAKATEPEALTAELTRWRGELDTWRNTWLELGARLVAVERDLASVPMDVHAEEAWMRWWRARQVAFREELTTGSATSEVEELRALLERSQEALLEAGLLLRRNRRSGFDQSMIGARRVSLEARATLRGQVDPNDDERDLWLLLHPTGGTARLVLDAGANVTVDVLPWSSNLDLRRTMPWELPWERVDGEVLLDGPCFVCVRAGLAPSNYTMEVQRSNVASDAQAAWDDAQDTSFWRVLASGFLGGGR